MAKYESKSLRNVAIVGHGGTGKTTLCESFLFVSGKTERAGRVDEGTSSFDYEPEEQRKHISISAATGYFDWDKHKVNIVDTPGDSNFAYDTRSCLRVVDAAVILVDAVSGVEFQTQKVWEYADQYKLPRIIFINRMDRERADFFKAVESVKSRIQKVTPIFLPVGSEESFKGVVDLIAMKAYLFEDPKGGYKTVDIPADLKDDAESLRETMMEDIAESDENLMEKYLAGEELSEAEIIQGIRSATIAMKICPVLCGTAFRNKGVQSLLDAVIDYMPSPLDIPAMVGSSPDNEEEKIVCPCDDTKPLAALAFKLMTDPFVGHLTFLRIYSGRIESGATVVNAGNGKKERIGRLLKMHANKREEIKEALAGDIVAAVGLKSVSTGDTLADLRAPVILESLDIPEPVIEVAIEPKTKADRDLLSQSLAKLTKEDPSFRVKGNEETGQTLIAGMGELHLEIIVDRLLREFNVNANVGAPRVAYRETITKPAKCDMKYAKQTGGRGQYAHVVIEIEPNPAGGYLFEDEIKGGLIPKEYIAPVGRGIEDALKNGVQAGSPAVDVKVKLVHGSFHEVDSSEQAFYVAGSMAIKEAAKKAGPVLLEPIMSVEVVTPEEYLGDVMGDLNGRRGRVSNLEARVSSQVIKAQVPLSNMFGYATDLRSRTQGRATFTMQFDHYEQVPNSIAEELMKNK